nr:hypothetical protein [uncultured Brumimicrobium sp.]
MNYSYLIKHWITTLTFSSLFIFIYSFFQEETYDLSYQLEIFFIFLLFSSLFALPTIIISFLLFHFLIKKSVQSSIIKLVIILTTVFGTFLTLYIISNSIAVEYTIVYSIVGVLSAGLYKLRNKST